MILIRFDNKPLLTRFNLVITQNNGIPSPITIKEKKTEQIVENSPKYPDDRGWRILLGISFIDNAPISPRDIYVMTDKKEDNETTKK